MYKAFQRLAIPLIASALWCSAWSSGAIAAPVVQPSDADLLVPLAVHVDRTLPPAQANAQTLAARRYYSFWNSGDAALAEAALAPDFFDANLPAGRPQGPTGPLLASKNFRRAVPDLRLRVEEMFVVGDKVIGRLHFSGHFSGKFGEHQGDGRAVDFVAVDIYTIRNGRIAENWHLEDNLTLLQQLGIVAR
ncbi:MAG TPA: ester cyclase [Pseudomonas sp.]|nr:ester cyclase [Pseudomonas sp.]